MNFGGQDVLASNSMDILLEFSNNAVNNLFFYTYIVFYLYMSN